MLSLAYSELYSAGISSKARFPRDRYRLVRAGLQPLVDAGAVRVREPRPATRDELVRVHDPGYVDAFLAGTLDPVAVRRIGLRPWTPAFVERVLLLTGGTLGALEELMAGARRAGNMAGGTHHAFADRGGGYCVFNDVALAARLALEEHGVGSVLVVDLDVHQGDGTAALFADEPRVTTLSVHGAKNYPSRKQASDVDVPLPDGTGDADYLRALDEVLPRAFADAAPELVIYQAGVDGLAEDKLGRLALTHGGLAARNQRVYELADAHGCPVLVTMGGGYGDPLEASVRAHVDVFAQAAGQAAG